MQYFNLHQSFISLDLIKFFHHLFDCLSYQEAVSSLLLLFFFTCCQFQVLKENKYFPVEIMLATRSKSEA